MEQALAPATWSKSSKFSPSSSRWKHFSTQRACRSDLPDLTVTNALMTQVLTIGYALSDGYVVQVDH